MKLVLLSPLGFCFGVQRSFDEAIRIAKEHQNNNVYMLGWLVHNEKVIEMLVNNGIKILDDTKNTRLEIAKQLEYKNGDVVILSAHGTDHNVIDLLKEKGFKIFDLTCPFVYKTHKLIKNKINNNYEIIFIGKKNHPESNAILKINNNINFITSLEDIEKLSLNSNKIFCTNQTTLSIYETRKIYEELKKKIPTIEFINDICDATTKRQQAIIDINYDVDLFIIVGDKRSSNANELLKLALTKTKKSYIVKDHNDIDYSWFKNTRTIVLTAAASAHYEIIKLVEEKIREIIND